MLDVILITRFGTRKESSRSSWQGLGGEREKEEEGISLSSAAWNGCPLESSRPGVDNLRHGCHTWHGQLVCTALGRLDRGQGAENRVADQAGSTGKGAQGSAADQGDEAD